MLLFIFSDTVFGIYTSIKLGGVGTFKSHKLFNVVIKSFFYLTTIIMAYLIDKYILVGSVFGIDYLLAKVLTFFWIYIETKSLDESSMKLGNKSFWVLLKELINKLKSVKKDLNELIEDKKE